MKMYCIIAATLSFLLVQTVTYCMDTNDCYDGHCHQHQSTHSLWSQASQSSFKCIAVLTAFPELKHHEYYTERILLQLTKEFRVEYEHAHVFCQGTCSADLFQGRFNVQFHSLNNSVDRTLYKGFIIAENYKLMMKKLFNIDSDGSKYDHCLILEDDLVLSPDAMHYLRSAVDVMKEDHTIFTASLYNDNSYPWCASDRSFFRRVDHFSGLGFIMSRHWYENLVVSSWDDSKVWDNNFQDMMASEGLNSIQPEVSRVLHLPYNGQDSTSENRRQFSMYTAQLATYSSASFDYNLDYLHRSNYEQFLEDFIKTASTIEYIEDAGFHKAEAKLLFIDCESERPCVDKLLMQHGLRGAGLGFMLRGAYKGTVFLRVYGRLVLILPQSSHLYRHVQEEHITEVVIPKGFSHLKHVERQFQGTIAILESSYRVLVSQDNNACDKVCSRNSLVCSRAGLWLINKNCNVLQYFLKDCDECDNDVRTIIAGPMMEKKEEGSRCMLSGSNFHLQCQGSGVGNHRRVCVCSGMVQM